MRRNLSTPRDGIPEGQQQGSGPMRVLKRVSIADEEQRQKKRTTWSIAILPCRIAVHVKTRIWPVTVSVEYQGRPLAVEYTERTAGEYLRRHCRQGSPHCRQGSQGEQRHFGIELGREAEDCRPC